MSRKLDKQQADLLGKEAEIDLLAELNRAFPGDRISVNNYLSFVLELRYASS
jgi:hypothetical protein